MSPSLLKLLIFDLVIRITPSALVRSVSKLQISRLKIKAGISLKTGEVYILNIELCPIVC